MALGNEARLLIPRDALSAPATITLRRLLLAGRAGAVGPAYEVVIEGAVLRAPARLEVTLAPPAPAADLVERMKLAYLQRDRETSLWVPLDNARVEPSTKTLAADTNGFDRASAVEFAPVLSCAMGEPSPCSRRSRPHAGRPSGRPSDLLRRRARPPAGLPSRLQEGSGWAWASDRAEAGPGGAGRRRTRNTSGASRPGSPSRTLAICFQSWGPRSATRSRSRSEDGTSSCGPLTNFRPEERTR
jgi:hypothetical protein